MTVFGRIVRIMFAAFVFVFSAIVSLSPVRSSGRVLLQTQDAICVTLNHRDGSWVNKTHFGLSSPWSHLSDTQGAMDVDQILTSMGKLYAQAQDAADLSHHITIARIVGCLAESLRSTAEMVVAIGETVVSDLLMTSTYTTSLVERSPERILRDLLRWPPSTLSLPSWRTSLELDTHLLTIQIDCLVFFVYARQQWFWLRIHKENIAHIEQTSPTALDSASAEGPQTHLLSTAADLYASGISALQYHVCKLLILSQAAQRWNSRVNGFTSYASLHRQQEECTQYEVDISEDQYIVVR